MSELTQEQQSVIVKVQKLLALANNNSNEAEAASASAKAQELLEAYNLSMATLDRSSGRSSQARDDTKLKGGLYRWQRSLWEGVAKLNYCMYWSALGQVKGSKFEHRILGSQVNVLATRLMAEYLQDTIERLARDRVNGEGRYFFTKGSIAYREGIASRLVERLAERRYELEQEATRKKEEQRQRGDTTNALTILDVKLSEQEANDDYIYGEGYTARRKAEQAAREERQRKAQEAYELQIAQDPEFAKAEEERIAKKRAAGAKWYADYLKKAARKGPTRERKADQPRHEAYYDGRRDGGSISLDQQVDRQNRKAIR